MLETEAAPGDPNKAILGKVLAQVERLSKTAVELLEFARPLRPSMCEVDVADLLDRTLVFVERQAAEQAVAITRRYTPSLPLVRADPDLLKQAFLNILLNALQAMPRGGMLEVESLAPSPSAVEVCIADQGAGISPENLARIFTPFFTTKASGTGLGLYVARQIVEMQRGEIQVSSRPGAGSRFTVRLPIAGLGEANVAS